MSLGGWLAGGRGAARVGISVPGGLGRRSYIRLADRPGDPFRGYENFG